MILCVDTKKLKTAPYVQKDIELGKIITCYVKYYENKLEAENDSYVPIDFYTSVRTVYSNLILKFENGLFYTNHTNVGLFVHKGYDLIMYLSATGLLKCVKYSCSFDHMMMKASIIQPIGLYNPDASLSNPIVYSHIIIKDEAVEQLKSFLKESVSLVSIAEAKRCTEGHLTALLDTLIEIKEGDEDNA